MTPENILCSANGHVLIKDDLGNVLVDKYNAIHPQNIARVLTRALANESNYWIHRIAFGLGGTETDVALNVTFKTPNDGQPPDVRTWDSRLYQEIYSEIVDDSNVAIGTDPGTAGPNVGTRPGGGANVSGDPESTTHVSGPGVRSNELGLNSEVVVTAIINPQEPLPGSPLPATITFDEIGLYTTGAPAAASIGTADVNVGGKLSTDDTGLVPGTQYTFFVAADGGAPVQVKFTAPIGGGSGGGGEILYGDLAEAINTGDVTWNSAWSGANPLPGGTTVSITDETLNFPTITGAETFGFLRFTSGGEPGDGSSVVLSDGNNPSTQPLPLFAVLVEGPGGTAPFDSSVTIIRSDGEPAGVQNDPVNPGTERERLLTHLIFSPVTKSNDRQLTVTYRLTFSIARTQS